MKHLAAIITTSLIAISSAFAAPPLTTVRQVSDVPQNLITVPYSFETDTHELQKNWYLQNFTTLNYNPAPGAGEAASDQDFIDRLQAIPAQMELPYNNVVAQFIRMYVERKKTLVETMLGMSLYYMPIFEQALDRQNMPLELKYLAVIESALNPNAVSPAGATGLWQFMLETGRGEGLEINSLVDQRRDPYASSHAAASYLKKLYNTYGDWSLAIAAYNCGPGNVNKAIRRAGGGKKDFWEIYPFLPPETRSYVPAFIAAAYAMTNYHHHGISPALASKPIVVDSVHINRRVHFKQISDVMGIPIEEIRALNPQYRQDIIPGDIHPYPLVLPNIQTYAYLANEDSIVNHDAELYARRTVVEPSTGRTEPQVSGDGEYVTESIVKYHKVRRGETLASIARRYGVTQNSIKRANNIGKRGLKRGQTLKINTTTRRWVPSVKTEAPADTTVALNNSPQQGVNDSTALDSPVLTPTPVQTPQDTTVAQAMTASQQKPQRQQPAQPRQPKTITHTIAAGENLFKIAKRYGITVDELKAANGLTGDAIQMGKTLKIPQKASISAPSAPAKKKSKKRRR